MKRVSLNENEETIDLPSEIWLSIFQLLPQSWHLLTPFSVCKRWASVVSEEVTSIGKKNGSELVLDCMLHRTPRLLRLRTTGGWFRASDKGIHSLTNLTSLHVRQEANLSVDALTALVNLTSLSCIGDYRLPRMNNLKKLSIDLNKFISDHDLRRFTLLESLSVYKCYQITQKTVATLTNLKKIKLHFSYNQDETLRRLTNLTSVSIHSPSSVTLEALIKLPLLSSLKMIETGGCIVDGEDLTCFSRLTHLTFLPEYFSVFNENVPLLPKTLKSLKVGFRSLHWIYDEKMCFPNLTKLDVQDYVQLSKEMLIRLPNLASLRAMSLKINDSITQKDLSLLTSIVRDEDRVY